MTLIRLYAWSCAVAIPVVLGLAIIYLYLDDRVGAATALVATFAIVAITATAISLQDPDEDASGASGDPERAPLRDL
jgi:hypothetical protein